MGLDSFRLLDGSGAAGAVDELSGVLSEVNVELSSLLVLSGALSEDDVELSSLLVLSGVLSEDVVELSPLLVLSGALSEDVVELSPPLVLSGDDAELSLLPVLSVTDEPVSDEFALSFEQAVSETANAAATKNDKKRFIYSIPF